MWQIIYLRSKRVLLKWISRVERVAGLDSYSGAKSSLGEARQNWRSARPSLWLIHSEHKKLARHDYFRISHINRHKLRLLEESSKRRLLLATSALSKALLVVLAARPCSDRQVFLEQGQAALLAHIFARLFLEHVAPLFCS